LANLEGIVLAYLFVGKIMCLLSLLALTIVLSVKAFKMYGF